MFRGGRVPSYGTGIASGLADGGRVGYATDYLGGIVSGRGAATTYNPYVKPEIITGGHILGRNTAIPDDYLDSVSLSEIFKPIEITEEGFGEYKPEIIPGKITKEKEEAELASTGDEGKRLDALEAMTADEAYKIAEKEPGEIIKVNGGGDDPTAVGDSDLESMISKYEDLLGMKKARGQDISDMLLLAGSKFLKPGATVKGGFSEFLGEEAKKGPGRGEKIKQAAAMLGIKGEQAQKLYETKLTNTTGMFTKKVEEIMSTENVSRSEAINKALGLPGSIDAAVIEFKKRGTGLMSESEFDMLARSQNISKLPNVDITQIADGDYYKPGGKTIVTIKDKTIVDTQTYE